MSISLLSLAPLPGVPVGLKFSSDNIGGGAEDLEPDLAPGSGPGRQDIHRRQRPASRGRSTQPRLPTPAVQTPG